MDARCFIALVLLISLWTVSTWGKGAARVNAVPAPATELRQGTGIPGDLGGDSTPSGWWASVQESIRRSEYHVTWQKGTRLAGVTAAYQAPNRAHNLRTYFTLTDDTPAG